ncbi:MAG: hypothetical protein Q9227_007299 [Pyrenula ochraceoflavens]
MEAVVHEDSPLASFLEGRQPGSQLQTLANWSDHVGQGECIPGDETSNLSDGDTPNLTSFAPRGLPAIRQRLRNVLPKPLKLEISPKGRKVERMQDTYSVRNISMCQPLSPADLSQSAVRIRAENERFLERFRFIIVGSQLLSERAKSATHRRNKSRSSNHDDPAVHSQTTLPFSLEGAAMAATSPFLLTWGLHIITLRSQQLSGLHWRDIGLLLLIFATVAVAVYGYAHHKMRQKIRLSALNEATRLTTASQAFDSIASSAFNLLVELEVVSRGYELGNQLPPACRLESQGSARTSLELRRSLLQSLVETSFLWVEVHHSLTPAVRQIDLERYHDIYDVTRHDIDECASGVRLAGGDEESLRHIRLEMARQFVCRKIVLCDLLALPADTRLHATWGPAIDEMRRLTDVLDRCSRSLGCILERQESQGWGKQSSGETGNEADGASPEHHPPTPSTPGREHVKMQLRRLDSMSQGIRSLHTRMMLLRDETNQVSGSVNESTEMSTILSRHYERIGTELRGLLAEWERGKPSMLLRIETPSHRRSSSLKPPVSPADSLSGHTAVEGSPSDALRVLSGEESNGTRSGLESMSDSEEIFEAISSPPTRQRSSLTREEKMAKMKEERQKRALLQEKAEANTNMLRELETVIKLRPHRRTSSRVTSV